jgi:DNA-binding MarR family transcriptional regulator
LGSKQVDIVNILFYIVFCQGKMEKHSTGYFGSDGINCDWNDMEKAAISAISRSLIEIAWYFGPQGLNGECCENLTLPEFIALDKVSTTPHCAVQDVGHALGFTKSGATRIVNRLEKKGYVQKLKSHEDGRICCVEITKSGERVLSSADSRYLEQFHTIAEKMPEYTVADTVKLLTAMAKALKG